MERKKLNIEFDENIPNVNFDNNPVSEKKTSTQLKMCADKKSFSFRVFRTIVVYAEAYALRLFNKFLNIL